MSTPHPQLPERPLPAQLWLAFDEDEAMLWRAVHDWGDPGALRSLANSLEPIDEEELGAGD